MAIICRYCNTADDYTTEQKNNNLVATCNNCKRFIKNIPTDKPKMYVGKYKGLYIEQIGDLHYLKWAKDNMNNLDRRAKEAVNERINTLSNLLR